jgi:hypothetical protein
MYMTLTPEQFNKLVTKNDLHDALDGYYNKQEMDQKFDQVLTAVDGLAKAVRDMKSEFVSN